jgi:AraC-like DNA-binding protein
MTLVHYRPAAPLDRYVECLWWSRRRAPQTEGEHILPSGRAQLVFALHEMPIAYRPTASSRSVAWTGSLVHGPQSSYYIGGPKPAGTVAGVSFRAGCAGAVLGTPASELADQHVRLDVLWGRPARELHERLLESSESGEPEAVFRIIERYLCARIRAPLLMHPAVAHALTSSWLSARVSDIQREAGYSARHFIALFNASVGVTPKHYYRIQRFNEVARGLASTSEIALADVAAAAGYSDQAHLTREFREFAGVPPTQYRGRFDSPLHHPMPAGIAASAKSKFFKTSSARSRENATEQVPPGGDHE